MRTDEKLVCEDDGGGLEICDRFVGEEPGEGRYERWSSQLRNNLPSAWNSGEIEDTGEGGSG